MTDHTWPNHQISQIPSLEPGLDTQTPPPSLSLSPPGSGGYYTKHGQRTAVELA